MWSKVYAEDSLAAGTYYSKHIILHDWMTLHAFQYRVVGSGRVTIEIETSIGGESWVSNGPAVKNAISTSGPASDGSDIIPLKLKIAEFIRFKVTVASASVTLNLWFTQK